MKTLRKKAKIIVSVASLLMLNTTVDISAVEAPAKRSLRAFIAKTGSSIKKSLAHVYQTVKPLDKSSIINKLLTNLAKLGDQATEIKDCMLGRVQCTPQKRAAFYATAITILALTAVVVGFTITVATTAKEPDKELHDAVTKTSHEVSGWSPAAIFRRLSNAIRSFKERLLSLKTCLVERKCFKSQKRMLYASAATISALVTTALGIGVGSSIYAQRQAEKRRQEEIQAQQKAERERERQEKLKEAHKKALAAKTEEERKAADQQLAELLNEAEQELKDLTQDPTIEEPEGPKTGFQKAFRKTVHILKESVHDIAQASKEVTQILKEKVTKATAALREKIKTEKLRLYQEARKALAQAKSAANNLITKIKTSGANFIEIAIKDILHIDINKLRGSFAPIPPTSAQITEHITIMNNDPMWNQINNITSSVFRVQELGITLWNNITAVGLQLTRRKAWTTAQWALGKSQAETDAIARNSYPLAAQFDDLWNSYPQILAQLNAINLEQPGEQIAQTLTKSAELIGQIIQVQIAVGTIGTLLIPETIVPPLSTLQGQLKTLAQNITILTHIRPLINTSRAPSTGWALYEVMKTYTKPRGLGLRLQEVILNQLTQIRIGSTAMTNEINNLNTLNTQLYEATTGIADLVKNSLIIKMELRPLNTVAHAPKILLQTVSELIEPLKEKLDAVLESSGKIMDHLRDTILHLFPLLHAVNDFIGSTQESPFISKEILDGIGNVGESIMKITNTVQQLRAGLKRPQAG